MKITKAVIPAAGLGTRFLPATKAQPKEMLPIVDKPTIQYIVEEAAAAGIEDIIIVTGRGKRAIEDHFDKSYELEETLERNQSYAMLEQIRGISSLANIFYVRQKEPLGLGHAILCAKNFIGNEPFAVLLGDDIIRGEKPAIGQLLSHYHECETPVIGLKRVDPVDVIKYGIIKTNESASSAFKIDELVEKPSVEETPSTIGIVGRYVLTPDIFPILEEIRPDKKGEYQLTDALNILSQNRSLYGLLLKGKRFDIGDPVGFVLAQIEFALENTNLRNQLITRINKVLNE